MVIKSKQIKILKLILNISYQNSCGGETKGIWEKGILQLIFFNW